MLVDACHLSPHHLSLSFFGFQFESVELGCYFDLMLTMVVMWFCCLDMCELFFVFFIAHFLKWRMLVLLYCSLLAAVR